MHFGFTELVIILAIVLIFVGPKQIPKLAKSIKESKQLIKEKGQEPEEQTEVENSVESNEQAE